MELWSDHAMNKAAPHLWTRRTKIIEPNRELVLAPRLCGFFKLEAVRRDGRRRLLADWFPNLITDVGLDYIGTSGDWVNTCVVGTGNSAPAFGNTALDAQLAATGNKTGLNALQNQTSDHYAMAQHTFRFATGDAEGNLSEIGIIAGGSNPLFSRALILDGGGSPTTITVLADEALDASYELRHYPPLTDLTTTMVISGVTYDVVVRAQEVDAQWPLVGAFLATGWGAGIPTFPGDMGSLFPSTSVLGAVTASPSGGAAGGGSGTNASYTPSSLVRDVSVTWLLTEGNVSGGAAACSIALGAQGSSSGEFRQGLAFQMSFDPPIPKSGSNNLTLNFRQSWARRSI
jgi:hypothetical protein